MPLFDRQKWDAKYAAHEDVPREPSAVLRSLEALLPRSGRALDVAGGAGRNAIWLAQRGLDVTIADVSPRGLDLACERARVLGVGVTPLCTDLEDGPFPAGPWDLILCVCYLWRPLYAVYPQALSLGGLLVVIQPTKKNLERHPKPPAGFLLNDGELPSLVGGWKSCITRKAGKRMGGTMRWPWRRRSANQSAAGGRTGRGGRPSPRGRQ